MKQIEDIVMFIPACGWGERVAERGVKPFLMICDGDEPYMALDRVMAMAPHNMDIEIAVRKEMGCPPLERESTVFFMEPTVGQAATIYQWMRRTRIRNYVLISNCDNSIDPISVAEGIEKLSVDRHRGVVFTFRPKRAEDNRWSYVATDTSGKITKIKEKEVISQDAVAGVYLLNMFTLRMFLYPEDLYLSDALARIPGLYAHRVREYFGWNDLQQLEELEKGVEQQYKP